MEIKLIIHIKDKMIKVQDMKGNILLECNVRLNRPSFVKLRKYDNSNIILYRDNEVAQVCTMQVGIGQLIFTNFKPDFEKLNSFNDDNNLADDLGIYEIKPTFYIYRVTALDNSQLFTYRIDTTPIEVGFSDNLSDIYNLIISGDYEKIIMLACYDSNIPNYTVKLDVSKDCTFEEFDKMVRSRKKYFKC